MLSMNLKNCIPSNTEKKSNINGRIYKKSAQRTLHKIIHNSGAMGRTAHKRCTVYEHIIPTNISLLQRITQQVQYYYRVQGHPG
jgi:hypothetical protein